MHALGLLLRGLIDYAGTFPPSELPMAGAVQHYAGYRRGRYDWVLGRFIVPLTRIDEFEHSLAALADDNWRPGPWRLTALAGKALDADVRRVLEFNRRHAESATRPTRFEAVDVKVLSVEDLERAAELVADSFELYVEVPVATDPKAWIRAARDADVRVKARTGGVTADLIPSTPDLARFLVECARAEVPFKATAGLHHAVRALRPLTANGGPTAVMHGFLNVFVAAALVSSCGIGTEEVVQVLEEQDPSRFLFDDQAASWGPHRVDADGLRKVRASFATGFGSCSFDDPIRDLQALGLIAQ